MKVLFYTTNDLPIGKQNKPVKDIELSDFWTTLEARQAQMEANIILLVDQHYGLNMLLRHDSPKVLKILKTRD